jgi:thymidine kinase
MYAGKSTAMLRDLQRYSYAKKRCVVIKHALDTRYDCLLPSGKSGIVCHDMRVYTIDVIIANTLAEAESRAMEYDCIGISEIQFYPDLMLADRWAGSRIVVAEGLDGTHTRENFGRIHELIPCAESVEKLSAVCECGDAASFTRKIAGDMSTTVDVGGSDKYVPVCRTCYDKNATPSAKSRS